MGLEELKTLAAECDYCNCVEQFSLKFEPEWMSLDPGRSYGCLPDGWDWVKIRPRHYYSQSHHMLLCPECVKKQKEIILEKEYR